MCGLVLVLCLCLCVVNSAKVLGVFPFGSASHYRAFEPLMLELARRGHNVTVYSPCPQKTKVPNFTDVNLEGTVMMLTNALPLDTFQGRSHSIFSDLYFLRSELDELEKVLQSNAVQDLISSNEKFDLVIAEYFNSELLLAFGHRFNAPYIAMSSCPLMPWADYLFSNPNNPSYIPVLFVPYSNRMSFVQRLTNTYTQLIALFGYRYLIMPKTQELVQKYFGEAAPSPDDLVKNASLLFVNTYFSLHGSQPFAKKIIETGGIHVKAPKKLPQDLEEFINNSQHGVVYFSLGSMLRGSSLKNETWKAFRDVFEKLPQRVLWKWEEDTMIDQPDNVKIVKWAPQQDILANENVKLFITHGGLLSITEAVSFGVPVVGIPVYGDQHRNMAAVEAAGVGMKININDLNFENIFHAVHTILNDPNYRTNAKQLAKRFTDRPMSPLDNAVYWTEYVMRHNGAPQLQSAASDLSWYQLLLLDVIAVTLAFITIITVLVIYVLKFLFINLPPLFSKIKQD